MAVEAGQATYCNEDLKLLASGNFSDAVIICGVKTWCVHKAIVCQRSGYFNLALNGHFKETADDRIDVRDESVDVLDSVLAFIYTGNYSMTTTPETKVRSASDHAQLYAAGHKYQVPTLMEVALDEFTRSIDALPTRLEVTDLIQAVRLVYGALSSFDQLCKPLIRHLCQHLAAVMQDDELADLINDLPGLCRGLLRYSAKQMTEARAAKVTPAPADRNKDSRFASSHALLDGSFGGEIVALLNGEPVPLARRKKRSRV